MNPIGRFDGRFLSPSATVALLGGKKYAANGKFPVANPATTTTDTPVRRVLSASDGHSRRFRPMTPVEPFDSTEGQYHHRSPQRMAERIYALEKELAHYREVARTQADTIATEKAERDRAFDLLVRIRSGLENGYLDIPDVIHAVEAEITELVGPSRRTVKDA